MNKHYLVLIFLFISKISFCQYYKPIYKDSIWVGEYGEYNSTLFHSKIASYNSLHNKIDSIKSFLLKHYSNDKKILFLKNNIPDGWTFDDNLTQEAKMWGIENQWIDKSKANKILRIYYLSKNINSVDSIKKIIEPINKSWRIKKAKYLKQNYNDILDIEVNEWIQNAKEKFNGDEFQLYSHYPEIDSLNLYESKMDLKIYIDKLNRQSRLSSISSFMYSNDDYESRLEVDAKRYADYAHKTNRPEDYKSKYIREINDIQYNLKFHQLPIDYIIWNWVECSADWDERSCRGTYNLIAPKGWQVCDIKYSVTSKRGKAKELDPNRTKMNQYRKRTRFEYSPINWYSNDREYPARFKGYRLYIQASGDQLKFSNGKIKLSNVGLSLVPDSYTNLQKQECGCKIEFPPISIQQNKTPEKIDHETYSTGIPDYIPNRIPDETHY